jgi:hypothetical protein
MFQNIKKYNRKTLKIEKDGFFFIKRKEKKWLNLSNIKIEGRLSKQSIILKKLIFITRKVRQKLKKIFWDWIIKMI